MNLIDEEFSYEMQEIKIIMTEKLISLYGNLIKEKRSLRSVGPKMLSLVMFLYNKSTTGCHYKQVLCKKKNG